MIRLLMKEIDGLTKSFEGLLRADLHRSHEFQAATEKMFARWGPPLWDGSAKNNCRRCWLVNAERNNWEGLYPRDLIYDNEKHRSM